MKCMRLLLLGAFAALASGSASAHKKHHRGDKRCFPDDFLFGSATASYQVEGGWNETGRTPSIWDDFCRERPGVDCANVADDFLHRYRDDIDLMVKTGLDSFRFSISWSRLMNWDAETKKMKPNAPGIAFYHSLIDELRRKHIVPILTLYHWDLPSELHRELQPQGWINPAIVDHFVQYADLVFSEFGSKINYWTTFNEPLSFIGAGYGTGLSAPGLTNSTTNEYTATHNVLLAHGKAVQRFRELKESKAIHHKARIGIVLNADFAYPLDPSDPVDVAAAERRMQFAHGWFLSPIVSGKYPDVMRERAGDRLPEFTEEEVAIVKDSYDLFMLNHYSSKLATDCKSENSTVNQYPGWERDLGIDESRAPPGARLSSLNDLGEYNCKWFTGYAPGYLESIKWLHAHNPNADILLTENGWCGNDTIENMDQLWYYQTYLGQVHKAITEFKIPVIGYTAWSFVDNYEWGSFKPRFGLYYVNFTSQTGSKDGYVPKATDLARIPRPAAKWYQKVSETKCLDWSEGVEISQETNVDALQLEAQVDVATDAHSDAVMSTGAWLVVLCAAFAAPAVVWAMKRRSRSRRTDEATPLMQAK
uniref:Beta-glucosidase n=1 Tax=Globisporangium ultimum (strain ATCC 200006 / CBS 805.95 / DAOM BR144) TaxID=431595 RepID=K3X8D7_GLOUD